MTMIDAILDRHETQTTPKIGFVDANEVIEAAVTLCHPRGTMGWADMVERLTYMVQGGNAYGMDEDEVRFARTLEKLVYGN
jgi:hypothetical protein